jgi:hypothetical protein
MKYLIHTKCTYYNLFKCKSVHMATSKRTGFQRGLPAANFFFFHMTSLAYANSSIYLVGHQTHLKFQL